MINHVVGFIILGAALLGVSPASAQPYLVGTKSHSQIFKSIMDPNSGYCPDGTHVHNLKLCGRNKGSTAANKQDTGQRGGVAGR
jgi:hypothetical protein